MLAHRRCNRTVRRFAPCTLLHEHLARCRSAAAAQSIDDVIASAPLYRLSFTNGSHFFSLRVVAFLSAAPGSAMVAAVRAGGDQDGRAATSKGGDPLSPKGRGMGRRP